MPKSKEALEKAVEKVNRRYVAKQYVDSECIVCRHPERGDIDHAYINWRDQDIILGAWSLKSEDLLYHASHARLDSLRRFNTDALYQRIVEFGIKDVDKLGIKAKDVLSAAKQLDRLHGRVIEKHEIDERKVVVFAPIPMPGGVMLPKEENKPQLTSGPTVPVLNAVFESPDDATSMPSESQK